MLHRIWTATLCCVRQALSCQTCTCTVGILMLAGLQRNRTGRKCLHILCLQVPRQYTARLQVLQNHVNSLVYSNYISPVSRARSRLLPRFSPRESPFTVRKSAYYQGGKRASNPIFTPASGRELLNTRAIPSRKPDRVLTPAENHVIHSAKIWFTGDFRRFPAWES